MASIILSFLGNQDPYSGNTDNEGSIVSLVNYLRQQRCSIKRIFLLHTEGTQQNALDTQHWLLSEIETLTEETIKIVPTDKTFSQDPINQLLAVQAARKLVESAQEYQTVQDVLEFNGSSGTPAMKACWSILQATGYAPRSHVWQVRNPKEMQPGQARVFKNDINALKNEVDLKVIEQQLQDYDYSAALTTIKASNLSTPSITALLNYGRCRILLDFDRAHESLKFYANTYPQLMQQIKALSPKKQDDLLKIISGTDEKRKHDIEAANDKALLMEAYWKAKIRLERQEYSNFLVDIFRIIESIPKFIVKYQIGLKVPSSRAEVPQFWREVKNFEEGKLYQYLQVYRFSDGGELELKGFITRYLLLAILEYFAEYSVIIPTIEKLSEYCDKRNDYVHGFKGISTIDNEHNLKADLRKVLMYIVEIPVENPFDNLNQQIFNLLDCSAQAR